MNHEEHKTAPILKFQLEKATSQPHMSEAIAERTMSDTPNGIIIGEDQLDNDLMEDPQAWTSIAEQYAPYEDDLDIEVNKTLILNLSEKNKSNLFIIS